MKRLFLALFVLLFILSACGPEAVSQATVVPPSAQPTEIVMTATPEPISPSLITLRRGINFGNMLESPDEGEWGLVVQEEYFDLVKDAGFDFVRLPVRWNTHAEAEYPYTIDPAFFARVDEIIGWALARELAIIVDFHHYEEIMTDPWSHKDRYIGIWAQVAEHYKDQPANVLFELLNEPNSTLDASLWNQYLLESLTVVRETNPSRDVVIGPVQWNSYEWLSTLEVPKDEHLIVTFHYYSPFQFTHQGAEWAGEEAQSWLGTEWGNETDQAEVISHFDVVADWSKRHGNVRILLGEFGVYSRGPQESRVRWTKFIREQAEAHGFAWAYWELASGFGVYDPEAQAWREDLLQALLP